MTADDLRTIRDYPEESSATRARQLLEGVGVHVMVTRNDTATMDSEICRFDIVVGAGDAEVADEVLRQAGL